MNRRRAPFKHPGARCASGRRRRPAPSRSWSARRRPRGSAAPRTAVCALVTASWRQPPVPLSVAVLVRMTEPPPRLAQAQPHGAAGRHSHPRRGGVCCPGNGRGDGLRHVVEDRVTPRARATELRRARTRVGDRADTRERRPAVAGAPALKARFEAEVGDQLIRRWRRRRWRRRRRRGRRWRRRTRDGVRRVGDLQARDVDGLEGRAGDRPKGAQAAVLSQPGSGAPLMNHADPLSASTIPCFLRARRITWSAAENPLMS